MTEPTIKGLDLPTNNGGGKKENIYVVEWAMYRAWYNAQPGNPHMIAPRKH